jgi:hypothetical protein
MKAHAHRRQRIILHHLVLKGKRDTKHNISECQFEQEEAFCDRVSIENKQLFETPITFSLQKSRKLSSMARKWVTHGERSLHLS